MSSTRAERSPSKDGLRGRATTALCWAGLLVPAAAWFAHLMVSYSIAAYLCEGEASLLLHSATAAGLILSLLGTGAAAWVWHKSKATRAPGPHGRRVHFMGISGFAMGCFFSVIIAVAAFSNAYLEPCGVP